MPPVAIPASGAPRAAERLLTKAFAQSTSATTDRGISLDSASKQSARANLVERSTREAVWVDPNSATQRDLFVSNNARVDRPGVAPQPKHRDLSICYFVVTAGRVLQAGKEYGEQADHRQERTHPIDELYAGPVGKLAQHGGTDTAHPEGKPKEKP